MLNAQCTVTGQGSHVASSITRYTTYIVMTGYRVSSIHGTAGKCITTFGNAVNLPNHFSVTSSTGIADENLTQSIAFTMGDNTAFGVKGQAGSDSKPLSTFYVTPELDAEQHRHEIESEKDCCELEGKSIRQEMTTERVRATDAGRKIPYKSFEECRRATS